MKRKIKIVDNITGRVTINEQKVRNLEHFHTQLTEKAHIFKSKKGKGSYTRKQKYGWEF